MAKTQKEPEDLGLKIGTQRHKDLENIRKGLEQDTRQAELTIDLNKEFLKTIDKMIKAEKEKFK